MLRLLHRHILKEILVATALAMGLFMFALLMGNAIRDVAELVAAGKLGPDVFIKLIGLLIPYVGARTASGDVDGGFDGARASVFAAGDHCDEGGGRESLSGGKSGLFDLFCGNGCRGSGEPSFCTSVAGGLQDYAS